MNKLININTVQKQWLILGGLFVLPFVLDSVFQWLVAVGMGGEFLLGPIGFKIIKSQGLLLSLFQIFLPNIASFSFVSIGVYLGIICVVINIMFLLRLNPVKTAGAILIGGVFGNILNRSFNDGYIVNWLYFFGNGYNLSFLFALGGGCIILIYFIKNFKSFKKNNLRRQLFVMESQYDFCLSISFTYILMFLSITCLSYMFIKNNMDATLLNSAVSSNTGYQDLSARITASYLAMLIPLGIFLCVLFSLYVVYLSNRVYGPIYALKKRLTDTFILNKKPQTEFKLRSQDHFKFLESFVKELESAKSTQHNKSNE